MGMDYLEYRAMVSPLKKLMQNNFEFRVFKRFLASCQVNLTKKTILEVGCGAGFGLELISKEFKPKRLIAFDIMPEMVTFAEHYTKKRKIPVDLFVGDIIDSKLPSNTFDCVFVFTVLHHTPKWPEALKEINRVLKLGGVLLINEHDKVTVDRFERFFKVKHPKKSRFLWDEFKEEIAKAGFKIIREKKFMFGVGLHFLMCIRTKNPIST